MKDLVVKGSQGLGTVVATSIGVGVDAGLQQGLQMKVYSLLV